MIMKTPNIKIVTTDGSSKELPNYECVNCDVKSFLEDVAIKHNQETKHEMWVKRR